MYATPQNLYCAVGLPYKNVCTLHITHQLHDIPLHQFTIFIIIIVDTELRGHVNTTNPKIPPTKMLVGGWVKCPIGNKTNWKTFVYIISLRCWASIRTSVTLCTATYYALTGLYYYVDSM